MPNTSLSLSDQHRTVVLHVIELQPQAYTWQMVLEEHCGSADCDCIIEAHAEWPTQAEAQAAGWAECNRLLNGPRIATEH
ncbi:MbtH protein [Cupriavidus sp. H18C1]|uniref:Uncharacterized protein n=1 Tax=Cupriavidus cauae TaxID=2608999 RepID=A0A5M8AJN8_9BURK|nr:MULTISPECIES: hypothetical protein [Cupriavidus]KAA0180649.1 hypothetical protein FX016_12255 [Cupriavidus gilardii]KAA6122952.1 hypothetical protein F1599_13605 [Cupriavidus cauae]MCA7082173.1 hypothetical protein [Cupriavidus sp. DB3]